MTDFRPKDQWPLLRRIHHKIPTPIGYRVNPDDEFSFSIDPAKVEVLEHALNFIDEGKSYREVADWLSSQLGESVSHQGVKNIWVRVRGSDPENPRVKQIEALKKKQKPKTRREIRELEVKRKIADAKRSLTAQQKKLEGYQENREAPKTPISGLLEKEPIDAGYDPSQVVFKPNEGAQTKFLAASEQEVLFGGAAGGGKSYAILADPMRYFSHPRFRGLILRRTNDELRELKWKSKELYERAFPGAVWREKDSMWVFPNGGQLWMTYLERDDDVLRYQGQSFSYIAFDELTQYPTPHAWNYMRSRLRTADELDPQDADLPIFMRATTNPGGPGHGWVKRMFIDPAPHGEAFDARDIDTGEVLKWPDDHSDPERRGKPLFQRRFIPSKLVDNPYLYRSGQYEANLLSLPEQQRRQLLEGDWNVADGAAFPEWRESIHTCVPFQIPHTWRKFRSCDYGYASYSAVHWYAIDPQFETLYVYRELYTSKKTGRDLARMVLQAEQGESISYGVLDSSVWHQRGHNGPSIAEEMIQEGTRWRPSDRTAGARVAGKNRLHELLKVNSFGFNQDGEEIKRPGIIFFNTCRQIISDLPVIPTDPDGSDDIDDRYTSDHAYDSIRYGVMSRPKPNNFFDGWGTNSIGGYRPADKVFGY